MDKAWKAVRRAKACLVLPAKPVCRQAGLIAKYNLLRQFDLHPFVPAWLQGLLVKVNESPGTYPFTIAQPPLIS